ncbi:MAG: hypothetical protein QXD42_05060 [Nitrososphaerales archaeon]
MLFETCLEFLKDEERKLREFATYLQRLKRKDGSAIRYKNIMKVFIAQEVRKVAGEREKLTLEEANLMTGIGKTSLSRLLGSLERSDLFDFPTVELSDIHSLGWRKIIDIDKSKQLLMPRKKVNLRKRQYEISSGRPDHVINMNDIPKYISILSEIITKIGPEIRNSKEFKELMKFVEERRKNSRMHIESDFEFLENFIKYKCLDLVSKPEYGMMYKFFYELCIDINKQISNNKSKSKLDEKLSKIQIPINGLRHRAQAPELLSSQLYVLEGVLKWLMGDSPSLNQFLEDLIRSKANIKHSIRIWLKDMLDQIVEKTWELAYDVSAPLDQN